MAKAAQSITELDRKAAEVYLRRKGYTVKGVEIRTIEQIEAMSRDLRGKDSERLREIAYEVEDYLNDFTSTIGEILGLDRRNGEFKIYHTDEAVFVKKQTDGVYAPDFEQLRLIAALLMDARDGVNY